MYTETFIILFHDAITDNNKIANILIDEVLRRRGEQLPLAGGYDENGEFTTDSNAILESCRALPIGYLKGSGLAFVLDLMAALTAAGDSAREISQREKETGVSQVFMAIDIVSQMGTANADGKVDAIIITPINFRKEGPRLRA